MIGGASVVENSIKVFASEESILLLWLSEHITKTKTKSVIKCSQNEIAEEFNCSPTTINKRIKALKRAQCIKSNGKKGYTITVYGEKIIKEIKDIETIVGGKKNGN